VQTPDRHADAPDIAVCTARRTRRLARTVDPDDLFQRLDALADCAMRHAHVVRGLGEAVVAPAGLDVAPGLARWKAMTHGGLETGRGAKPGAPFGAFTHGH
jgi:hypothetical protein